jgi:hypothetical protein
VTGRQKARLDARDTAKLTRLQAQLASALEAYRALDTKIAALRALRVRRQKGACWRGPNDPTAAAKQLWRAVYPGEPWPKGWRVRWVGFMRGTLGLACSGAREILLSHGDAAGKRGHVVEVLIHEFIHARGVARHGPEFTRLVNRALSRLGLPLETRWPRKAEGVTEAAAAPVSTTA